MFKPLRCLIPAVLAAAALAAPGADWPSWRGPLGTSVSPESAFPLRWSATENVRWKTPLPDRGNSSPIVSRGRVFLTQALERENRRMLLCFDRATGKRLWEYSIAWNEKEPSHPTNPPASASPVTDGERVYAFFGSAGLHCVDWEGKPVWTRDLGPFRHEWGYAASPVLHGDLVVLYFGPTAASRLLALHKKTGEVAWEVPLPLPSPAERDDGFAGQRNGVVGSWSTPMVVRHGDRHELILSLPEQVKACDPATGRELWSCGGLNPLVYTSPLFGNGVVVAMGGYLGTTIAVTPGGQGDVTESRRLWSSRRTKNRLGSGVIAGDHVFILNTESIAECIELRSGKVLWQERLRGPKGAAESWSSMVLAGDRIYIPNQRGETFVLRASPRFELLSVNPLDGETVNSTPAFSDGQIFIRTHGALWCIAENSP